VNKLSLSITIDSYALLVGRAAQRLSTIFLLTLCFGVILVHAQQLENQVRAPLDDARLDSKAPLVIDGTSESDIISWGQSIKITGLVKKHGAVALGGDVIVEGRVEGDVAAIGGSVIQRENSYIGGDVIVLGGAYHHGKNAPERNPASTTVMIAGFEQELREMMRNPASALQPSWSPAYLGQRVLAVLFWFIASLALTAVTPGAVGRAVARLRLTNLRVAVIGFLAAIVIALGVPACLYVLPPVVSALVMIMALLLLILAYLFGRVVIHAVTGRWLQKLLLPEEKHSESIALLLGVSFWAIVLSLPYVWPLALLGLMLISLGLALTARYRLNWKRAD
jgi:hypothetical protein